MFPRNSSIMKSRIIGLLLWMCVSPLVVLFIPTAWKAMYLDGILPWTFFVLAAWILPRKQVSPRVHRWRWLKAVVVGCVGFFICYSILGVGYVLDWVTFSYGAWIPNQKLHVSVLLFQFPLLALTVALGHEWVLRGALWKYLQTQFLWPLTLIVASVLGFLVQWPRFLTFLQSNSEMAYVVSALVELLGVEVACGMLVIASGRLLPAIAFHVLMRGVPVFFLGDVLDRPYMPLMNFVSSNPSFYFWKASIPWIFALILFLFSRGRRTR
jgi:hypothetical protein